MGAASIVYVPNRDFPSGQIPSGRATLRFQYEFTSFPSSEAIQAGQVVAESYVLVSFLNVDPDKNTTAPLPLSEKFIVEPGKRPRLNSKTTKLLEAIVPQGTQEIRVQIVTGIALNLTGEKAQVAFSDFSFSMESQVCRAFLATDRQTYRSGETVLFTFSNMTGSPISLPNQAPWSIKDQSGQVVFSPPAAQQIFILSPKASFSGSWDQKDNNRQQVPLGTYTLEFRTETCGTFVTSFSIN